MKIHSSDTPLPLPDGGGESEKVKKDGGSRVQGQVFLKGREGRGGGGEGEERGRGLAGTFPISFFHGLSISHLEIALPFAKLCYAFEEKLFSSATMIYEKRSL